MKVNYCGSCLRCTAHPVSLASGCLLYNPPVYPKKRKRKSLCFSAVVGASKGGSPERQCIYCDVLFAGPEAMVRTAAMTAWRLNDESKGAYLHFHRATHEL